MDKLKIAFKVIADEAKRKRSTGEVPTFLGVRGMLALMYDRIAKFMQVEDDDVSKYVLDLAVNALFAFSTVLPDIDLEEDETTTEETDDEPAIPTIPETNRETEETEDESNADPRWTTIPPGSPLPTAKKRKVDES